MLIDEDSLRQVKFVRLFKVVVLKFALECNEARDHRIDKHNILYFPDNRNCFSQRINALAPRN